MGAAIASTLLHAAPVAFLLVWPTSNIYGVSSKPSEDVSLETLVTVNVEVLETIDEVKPPAAAIDQVAVPASPPSPDASDPKETVEQVARKDPKPDTPQIEPDERPPSPPPDIAALEKPEPADVVRREPTTKPEIEPPSRAPASPPMPPAAAKPAAPALAPSKASHGPEPGSPGSQKATASHGDMLAYAGLVRGRLAKRKPKTRGHVGTVIVAFGIDRLGTVAFANIQKASGVPLLDQAALKAVREAGPFPPPPDGRDHSFELPFEFR